MEQLKEYAFQTVLDSTFEETRSRVTEALQSEGFGVLTEIDVKAVLKKKLDQDFRNYVILGACNPPFAHQSLQADLDVGLLLPCNVILYETDDRKTFVAAINPVSALQVIKNEKLKEIAQRVSEKLKTVIRTLEEGH
jgi:uncharacterized protein (DUF302 family)